MCKHRGEDMNHLFLHCDMARDRWSPGCFLGDAFVSVGVVGVLDLAVWWEK